MAEDTSFHADGGGKVTASQKPLYCQIKSDRFLLAVKRSRLIPDFDSRTIWVNNKMGIINTADGKVQSIFSFNFKRRRIQTIFAIVNPEKINLSNK